MADNRSAPRPTNPLKDENESKKTTRENADDARPGGSSPSADTRHPSQHGGVTGTQPQTGEDRPNRSGVKRSGPSPADEPSSDRTGTAPDRSGGPTRSGKTDGVRRDKGRDG